MRYLAGAVEVIHPFPVLVVMVTSAVLLVLAARGRPAPLLAVRVLGVILLSQLAVGALNDYEDREVDARAQPDKPIPSGRFPAGAALGLTWVSLILIVPLAATFGVAALALACVGTAGGLAYDLWLKPTALSFIGYLVGFLSLFTWIWLVTGRLNPEVLLIYPAGALIVITAHLAQSYPDVESDRAVGQGGLAARLGAAWTLRLIFALFTCLAVGVAAIVASTGTYAAAAPLVIAIALGLAAGLMSHGAPDSPTRRERLFHLVAPALALLAVATLLSIGT